MQAKQQQSVDKSPSGSIDRLKQILSQLEQDLKDADPEDRKEISRHIRNTKMVMEAIKRL